jgi:replicative DNA helicase
MTDRTPPHDVDAERAVLGSMLLSPVAAELAMRVTAGPQFWYPAHETLWNVIVAEHRATANADPITVCARLQASGELQRIGGAPYLHTLVSGVPTATNVEHYARIVADRAKRRRAIAITIRAHQAAWSTEGDDADALIETCITELEHIRDYDGTDETGLLTVDQFLDVPEKDAYDWIVPDILERGDRLLITGNEGAGKSEMLRQLATCTAAGVHAFTHRPIEAKRVLVLDMENSETQTRRHLRPIVTTARRLGHALDPERFWIQCRPEGLDLNRETDIAWLMRRVAEAKPDLLITGSLYKMTGGRAINSDDDAGPVLAAFNAIRGKGVATVIEAHAGHVLGNGGKRDLRPRGSAALLGWPEFGYGMRHADDATPTHRVVELIPWRGDRDQRQWPERLEEGNVWPWQEATPQGFRAGAWAS